MKTVDTIKLEAKDYQKYFNNAISYEAYLKNFTNEILEGDKSPFAEYLPQNWQRQSRLDRKFKLSDTLLQVVENIDQPLRWLVITEHWCGDASQINPIIHRVAEASNGKIDLRFIYRDENEALIDAHLTDGRSRSIPILIQLDDKYNLLDTYGPRPAEAQVLVKELLKEAQPYNIPLHTWYARDKQVSLQNDLIKLLSIT